MSVAVIIDTRGGIPPRADVRGHRSKTDVAPHVVLVLTDDRGTEITALLSTEHAAHAQSELALALAVARRPRREEASGE